MSLNGRIPRTMQFVLGLAVSGGLFLCMSGQAWAATSMDAPTKEIMNSEVSTTVNEESSAMNEQKDVLIEMNDAQPATHAADQKLMDHGQIISESDASKLDASETVTASSPDVELSNIGNTLDSGLGEETVSRRAALIEPTLEGAPEAATQVNEPGLPFLGEVDSVGPHNNAIPSFSRDATAVTVQVRSEGQIALSSTTSVMPGDAASGVAGRETMVLSLQPSISSNNQTKAMAAGLPVLPKPVLPSDDRKSIPSSASFALLGELTVNMAGVVVPEIIAFMIMLASPEVIQQPLGDVVILEGLLLSLALFTAWLRRSGFVGAARSDVAASLTSVVAPVDYVELMNRQHSFLFSVNLARCRGEIA